MAMVHEVYDRGQIVIPKYIREMLGWDKGTKVSFHVEENQLVLKRADDVLTEIEELVKEANMSEKDVEKLIKKHKQSYVQYLIKRSASR